MDPQPNIMGMENFTEETRETAFIELIKNLYDETKILFISRLNESMLFNSWKHIIIRHMYNDFFMNIEVKVHLEPMPYKRPFYRRVITNVLPDGFYEKLKTSYWSMYVDILKVSISRDGLGRHESFNVLKATDNQIDQQEFKEARLQTNMFK